VQLLRTEFWQQVRDLKVEDLIFIDEAGVNLAMVRLYARSLRGQRARGARPHKRGKNVSIIGAISVKEIVTSINLLGGIDGITFEAFISQKLVPKLWKGAWVLMDNYSIHKGEEVEKAIEAVGARVIYLPPYSPDFSPSENCWSKVKEILRSLGARTYQALEQAIAEAFSQVSEQDIRNWFTHCCYCTSST
jgi:transposase